jgi:cysteine desulfurase
VRHGTNILAQEQGGAQERYRRAGTENVAGAVGMAVALELAVAEQPLTVGRLAELRDRLAAALSPLPDVEETGHVNERLPGLASFLARGLDGAAVTTALDLAGLACSTGSACVTGSTEVSHVLTAMGYPEDEARGALRFSLGRTTTSDEIEEAAALIVRTITVQRGAAAKLRTKELVLAATKSPGPDRGADMGAAVE